MSLVNCIRKQKDNPTSMVKQPTPPQPLMHRFLSLLGLASRGRVCWSTYFQVHTASVYRLFSDSSTLAISFLNCLKIFSTTKLENLCDERSPISTLSDKCGLIFYDNIGPAYSLFYRLLES